MTKVVVYTTLIALMAASVVLIDSRNVQHVPSPAQLPGNRVYAMGMVEGATKDIWLSPEIPGRVVEIPVRVGDWVAAGGVLLRLDDRRLTQQLAVSRAQLDLARAQLQRLINGAREEERAEARALVAAKQSRLQQAHRTWQRVQELLKQAAISQQESDDQQGLVGVLTAEVAAARARLAQLEAPARVDELCVAQARVAAAEAAYELAKIALEKTLLVAPRRGQVLDVNVEPGEYLGANDAAPAIVLSDTSVLRVRAFVEEIDAPQLRIGMTAQITADGLPGHIFTGRIASLSPRMQAKTVSSGNPNEMYDTKVREVLLEINDAQQLLVGLRVDVIFDKLGSAIP